MKKNYIALVFPEFEDSGNVTTSSAWKYSEIPNDDVLGSYLKKLNDFVDFYKDEECLLMYDAKNVEAFTFVMKELPDCYPMRERALRSVLKGLENWRSCRVSSVNDEYTIHYLSIKDEIRTEIAARMAAHPDNSYLLAVHILDYTKKEWQLFKEQKEYTITSYPLSVSQVFEWLSSHRCPERKYNWNPKHGELGKGAHPGNNDDDVSVLLCSRGQAAELLQKAVGEPGYDVLYCFDPNQKKFMVFKADCKYHSLPTDADKRDYHSYHIEKAKTVPNTILRKLDMLKEDKDE